jgi:DNA adenine methylase Dam
MFVETPFNFTGSKFKLLSQLVPLFDYTKPYFVDVFCGGGSVYTNVVDKYEKVLVNDIISDLIGIHKGLIESDEIMKITRELTPKKGDKEAFLKLRTSYNFQKSPEKLWSLMLSSTNNMMRFNQKFQYNQTYGERGWNDNTTKKVEAFTNHIRNYKDKIKFISNSFNEIPVKSNKIMFYCDPPYSNTEAGYNAYWKKDDDQNLMNYLLEIDDAGSSFMISGSLTHDGEVCGLLKDLISRGFNHKILQHDYNKVSRKGKKETQEIIIYNY